MELPVKTVYYDSYNDDFAGTDIKTKAVEADFPYIHQNILWKASEFCLYHIIARPLVWLISKFWLGVRINGREKLKELDSPFFLYGNHTHLLDVFVPNMVTRNRKAHVVASADTVSIKGLRTVVQMLGAMPVPSTLRGMVNFRKAVRHNYENGHCIAIYPEAHIWPYCSFIRPFSETSFTYPAELNAPVVAMVTTYRKRKGIFAFSAKPAMTVTLSKPIYPRAELSRKEQAKDLRDKVFEFMNSTAETIDSVEYIRYEARKN